MNPKCSLRSHVDGVRDIAFSYSDPILASISEDCMVALWDTRKIQTATESTHIDPYYILRHHAGPLFALTGNQTVGNSSKPSLFYTGGSEGQIRVWNPPHPDSVNASGPCGDLNFCVGLWNAHSDVIWDLKHHPLEVNASN